MELEVPLMREILGMGTKIRGIIEVVFPHLCFTIQMPELKGEFALRAELILDQRTDQLQIRVGVLSIKIGFRNMEPLICTNNKTQQEELQEYLNQEQTDLLSTLVQDRQGLLHSTQWYSIPQTCHLIHKGNNQTLIGVLKAVLEELNPGRVFKILRIVGMNLQNLQVQTMGFHKGHPLHQEHMNLLELLGQMPFLKGEEVHHLGHQEDHQSHQVHKDRQVHQGRQVQQDHQVRQDIRIHQNLQVGHQMDGIDLQTQIRRIPGRLE